jgi:hypothetical protein
MVKALGTPNALRHLMNEPHAPRTPGDLMNKTLWSPRFSRHLKDRALGPRRVSRHVTDEPPEAPHAPRHLTCKAIGALMP